MKSVNYSRYTGDELGISAEDLMRALADLFLRSGFDSSSSISRTWIRKTSTISRT